MQNGGKKEQTTPDKPQLEEDEEYQQSIDDEIEVPNQNEVSEAIFKKYQKQFNQVDQVIKQEDEEDIDVTEKNEPFKFKIKNLDTGEQIQIDNDEQDEKLDRKWSQGLHNINNAKANWNQFWIQVTKNNEKLRQYCEEGQYDEASDLLTHGQNNYPALINHRGLDDWTPLHYACYEGHDDIVELLCEHQADIHAVTKFNRNALLIATLRGHIEVVKVLLKYKIDMNAYDNDGNTALHFAAENGYKEIINFLLENKCKILKNKEGQTPIHDCCDESMKKIFYSHGFKEDGQYEQAGQVIKEKGVINKVERKMINSGGIGPEEFVYHRLLGKGSFGEVFLVHKKDDETKRLYAMKVLSKDKVMTKNLKRYALTERNVMSVINHPFMVKLNFAFQSATKLFLVMDYYPGGDLGKLIGRKRVIPEEQAKKYICELILAFEALHKNMIVFRDLKPDNVVLDYEGHCRLTDFGLSKEGIYNNTTGSFCGSVAYLAPEILTKQGHSRTVDWYLLGLLFYELIVGIPPYYNSKKQVLFDNIKRGPLKIPKTMSPAAKDLIKKLLCRDPRKRLGAERDSEQLKEHEFFQDVNWQEVFARKLQMPPIDEPKWNLNETIKMEGKRLKDGPLQEVLSDRFYYFKQMGQIKLNLNKVQPTMYRQTKISNISEPTQAERPKKFVRQNSFCSIQCRSRSAKRQSAQRNVPIATQQGCQFTVQLPLKMQTQSMKYNSKLETEFETAKKSCSGSMKATIKRQSKDQDKTACRHGQLNTPLSDSDEIAALKSQLKKMKIYFNQQRQRRKSLEAQAILNKQEIKRLQKRLDKYKSEIQRLQRQSIGMSEHIKELQLKEMSDQKRQLQSYRVKYLEEQIGRVKAEMQKSKSRRQKELLMQIDKLIQLKYTLQKQLNAAIVGKNAIVKQLEDAEQELQEIRTTVHQKVIRSVQYIELRERYRLLLVETRWLKEEIDHLQKIKIQEEHCRNEESSQVVLENLLTVSEDSLYVE